MKLPSEDGVREYIRTGLEAELQLATEVLGVGLELFENSLTLNTENEPTDDELWLCLGVVAKACKQYRAIGALVELGLGEVASNNCRMLMETSFAAQFLMQDEVKLLLNGKEFPDPPGPALTTAFRTQLYIANDALSLEKFLRGMAESGGLKNAEETLRRAKEHADTMCAPIGADWRKRLKDANSFSGLSIFDLAASFGRKADYATFYRPANPGVHGADARKSMQLEEGEDGALRYSFPTTSEGVADALALASHVFLDVAQMVSLRFGLGAEGRTRALRQRVLQMRHG